MINLYQLLCNPQSRQRLQALLNRECPELLECDANHHVHDQIDIIEYPHHFFDLAMNNKAGQSSSYQCLWSIYPETPLDAIEERALSGYWGYKLGASEPWQYPHVGRKVKYIILRWAREQKLTRILA